MDLQRRIEILEELHVAGDELDLLAQDLQSLSPSMGLDYESLRPKQRSLREQYMVWMRRSEKLLPAGLRDHFTELYNDGISDFLQYTFEVDPSIMRDLMDQVMYDRYTPMGTNVRWRYDYLQSFRPAISEQQELLSIGKSYYIVEILQPNEVDSPLNRIGINLHHSVIESAQGSFDRGDYRNAITDASRALSDEIQRRTGITDIDNTELMQRVFSERNPIFRLGERSGEQMGFMFLFAGLFLAPRNILTHKSPELVVSDVDTALEILGLISFLFRQLDRAELVPPSKQDNQKS